MTVDLSKFPIINAKLALMFVANWIESRSGFYQRLQYAENPIFSLLNATHEFIFFRIFFELYSVRSHSILQLFQHYKWSVFY